MSIITFKKYQDQDWESICNVFAQSSKVEIQGCCTEKALRPLESYEQAAFLKNNCTKVCAFSNNQLIGYIGYSIPNNSISSLYILPHFTGKQIGKTLLRIALINLGVDIKLITNKQYFIEKEVINSYPSSLHLTNRYINVVCMTNNFKALNLYRSHGFIPVKTCKELLNGYVCLYTTLYLTITNVKQ